MKKIQIRNRKNDAVIYNGTFPNLKTAIEKAITENVSLAYAKLAGATLDNASLDGGDFRYADFAGASLIGANISEADLTGAAVTGADLTMACLCDSHLINVDFSDTTFGCTLITGAAIDNCIFNCPTALTLPFLEARLGHNTYVAGARAESFSAAPIVITGLPKRIVYLDSAVLIGNTAYPREGTDTAFLKQIQGFCAQSSG